MKLIIKVAVGVFLGIGAILLVREIPNWYEQAGTRNIKLQEQLDELSVQVSRQSDAVTKQVLELENQVRSVKASTQTKQGREFAKRLANMTPNRLAAACGKPDKVTVKKEAEDTLRILEYKGRVEIGFRYPTDPTQAPYLGSTDSVHNHSIGSRAWGQELIAQLPCVEGVTQRGR